LELAINAQERTTLGEYGASHCNQWGLGIGPSCVKVREAIELPFWVVSGMVPGILVSERGAHPPWEGGEFGNRVMYSTRA